MNVINIGTLGHKLKSPLVSIQSLSFILRTQHTKNDKKATAYLKKIEDRVLTLNKRLDQLITFLNYQYKEVEFLYQVFDISEIIGSLNKKDNFKIKQINQIVVWDKEKIIFSLLTLLKTISKIKKVKVSKTAGQANFEFTGKLEENKSNKEITLDEESNLDLDLFIARRIIELHGGKVKEEKNKLTIILPLKAVRKK